MKKSIIKTAIVVMFCILTVLFIPVYSQADEENTRKYGADPAKYPYMYAPLEGGGELLKVTFTVIGELNYDGEISDNNQRDSGEMFYFCRPGDNIYLPELREILFDRNKQYADNYRVEGWYISDSDFVMDAIINHNDPAEGIENAIYVNKLKKWDGFGGPIPLDLCSIFSRSQYEVNFVAFLVPADKYTGVDVDLSIPIDPNKAVTLMQEYAEDDYATATEYYSQYTGGRQILGAVNVCEPEIDYAPRDPRYPENFGYYYGWGATGLLCYTNGKDSSEGLEEIWIPNKYRDGTICKRSMFIVGADYDFDASVTKFTLCEGITEIKYPYNKLPETVTEVTIPDSMVLIGEAAFAGTSITSIDIPDSVVFIGKGAFYGCKDLSEVKLPKGLKILGEEAFEKCESLKSIDLPEGLEKIGQSAFLSCYEMDSLRIPSTVTDLAFPRRGHGDENAYYETGLRDISTIILANVTLSKNIRIGGAIFYDVDNGFAPIVDDNGTTVLEAGTYNKTITKSPDQYKAEHGIDLENEKDEPADETINNSTDVSEENIGVESQETDDNLEMSSHNSAKPEGVSVKIKRWLKKILKAIFVMTIATAIGVALFFTGAYKIIINWLAEVLVKLKTFKNKEKQEKQKREGSSVYVPQYLEENSSHSKKEKGKVRKILMIIIGAILVLGIAAGGVFMLYYAKNHLMAAKSIEEEDPTETVEIIDDKNNVETNKGEQFDKEADVNEDEQVLIEGNKDDIMSTDIDPSLDGEYDDKLTNKETEITADHDLDKSDDWELYRAVLDALVHDPESNDGLPTAPVYCSSQEASFYSDAVEFGWADTCCYKFFDLDGNGIDELFVSSGGTPIMYHIYDDGEPAYEYYFPKDSNFQFPITLESYNPDNLSIGTFDALYTYSDEHWHMECEYDFYSMDDAVVIDYRAADGFQTVRTEVKDLDTFYEEKERDFTMTGDEMFVNWYVLSPESIKNAESAIPYTWPENLPNALDNR